MEALDQTRGEEIGIEVLLEALLDPGSQHLDRHRLRCAVGGNHLGLMHLRDRGRGNGRTELGINRLDGTTERILDRRSCLRLRKGRQAVLEG
jgi:hypothetical protein